MNDQSISSTSFVISAVYTFTFANSVFYGIAADPEENFSPQNIEFHYENIVCSLICIILTLRCFFGNNNYIYEVLSDNRTNHWVKFYHFLFIAVQSVVLLVSSYFIQTPFLYAMSVAIFFGFEIFWYALTFLIHRDGVILEDVNETKDFAIAEGFNAFLVLGILAICYQLDVWSDADVTRLWINLFLLLFIVNTVYDAKKNMKGYMGS